MNDKEKSLMEKLIVLKSDYPMIWKYIKTALLASISAPFVIWLLYVVGYYLWGIPTTITAGDALGYWGAFLAFIGTVALGALALWQNNKANQTNERMLQLEDDKLIPIVDIKSVKSWEQLFEKNCINSCCLDISINNNYVFFFDDNSVNEEASDGHASIFMIKNLKDHDIISITPINISFDTIYSNGIKINSEIDTLSWTINGAIIAGNEEDFMIITGIYPADPINLSSDEMYEQGFLMPQIELLFELELVNFLGKRYVETLQIMYPHIPYGERRVNIPRIAAKKIISIKEAPNDRT